VLHDGQQQLMLVASTPFLVNNLPLFFMSPISYVQSVVLMEVVVAGLTVSTFAVPLVKFKELAPSETPVSAVKSAKDKATMPVIQLASDTELMAAIADPFQRVVRSWPKIKA
jgi:hypothetical protein